MKIERLLKVRSGLGWSSEYIAHIELYNGVIDMLSGEEILANQNIQIESTHILIGPLADIKEGDRVIHNGIVYDVKYVDNPMNLNKHLEITLKRSDVNEV